MASNCDKIYRLSFGGNKQVIKILNWLYKDSDESIRLDRKYEIYLKYLESYNNMELKQ